MTSPKVAQRVEEKELQLVEQFQASETSPFLLANYCAGLPHSYHSVKCRDLPICLLAFMFPESIINKKPHTQSD